MDTDNPYTLPLTQEVSVSRCIGPYTEIDRKLWAILVSMAWDNLDKKRIHEVNYREIASLFRKLKGAPEGSSWLLDSAKRLQTSRLEWENHEEIGSSPLLCGVLCKKETGRIFYHFDDFLLEKLLNNKRFSRLRLHFMIGLSGKYSVSLYMLLEAGVNLRNPVIDLSMEDLRAALNVPKGKLTDWRDLNKKALQPAIKQINENSDAAGFSVEMKPKANGRKYEGVQFILRKAQARVMAEIKERPLAAVTVADPPPPPVDLAARVAAIQLKTFTYEHAKTKAQGYDIYALEADWKAWLLKSGKVPENPDAAFVGFCAQKAEKNPLC